jgi:hypothetical protein
MFPSSICDYLNTLGDGKKNVGRFRFFIENNFGGIKLSIIFAL